MEHPKLKRSPIVEAVGEFRLAPEAWWDWTVPGLLFPAVEADYPLRREVAPQVFTLGSPPPGGQPPPPPERFQFLSRDELAMVQSGPRMLAINHLAPYPGWERFSALILRALDIHVEKCGWQPLQRVGLLYINRIETEEPATEILSVAPRTEPLPENVELSKFIQQWELSFDESGITLTTTQSESPRGYVIQVDAFTLAAERLASRAAVAGWLELAHETAYQVFEGSLTSATFGNLKE
jgi:uncharacterized protein (TIGR04255 family)